MSTTVPDPASTDWVPLFDLGRQPVKYLGSYSASTTYNDGDVVIGPDGIAYICVVDGTLNVTPSWTGQNPPAIPLPVVNGQWIKGVGGAAVWSPLASYGTTLPASPLDGDEAVLVDSITNPTYQWRFRYNAGSSSAYKWEYVGGAPTSAYISTSETPSTPSGWSDCPTVGPSITLARAGDYMVQFDCAVQIPGAGTYWVHVGIAVNGSVTGAMEAMASSSSGYYATTGVTRRVPGLAANTVLKMQYNSNSLASVNYLYRALNVTPVRVQ